jgi:hypothetical protein
MLKDPYLENELETRELNDLTKEEIFEEGYYAGQTWNTLPISDATYNNSDELIMYVVKTKTRSFFSHVYDYFIAYYIDSQWVEIHTAKNIEDGGLLKVVEWKII